MDFSRPSCSRSSFTEDEFDQKENFPIIKKLSSTKKKSYKKWTKDEVRSNESIDLIWKSMIFLGRSFTRSDPCRWKSQRLVEDIEICWKRSYRCPMSTSLGTFSWSIDYERTLDRRRRQTSDWTRTRLWCETLEFNRQRIKRTCGKTMSRKVCEKWLKNSLVIVAL